MLMGNSQKFLERRAWKRRKKIKYTGEKKNEMYIVMTFIIIWRAKILRVWAMASGIVCTM